MATIYYEPRTTRLFIRAFVAVAVPALAAAVLLSVLSTSPAVGDDLFLLLPIAMALVVGMSKASTA